MDYSKIDKDFRNLEKHTDKLIDKYNRSVDKIKSQELAIQKVKNKLDELNSSNKVPSGMTKMVKETEKMQEELDELRHTIDFLSEQKNKDESRLNQLVEREQSGTLSGVHITEMFNIKESLPIITKELQEQQNLYDALLSRIISYDEQIEKATNDYKSIKSKDLNSQLDLLNSKLSQTKSEANELKNGIKDAFNKRNALNLGVGVEDIGKKIDKFKIKMSRLIGTAFIFSLLRNNLTNLRNGFISLLNSNDQFNNSLNQIKANLMTAFAPIYNACLPAINSLMNALSKLTGTIAVFISGLFGTSLNDAKKQAQGLSKSLDKTAKSGEKASGSLASFDKLEVINDNSAGGNINSGSGIDYGQDIEYSSKLLDFLNKIKEFVIQNKELIIGFLFGLATALTAIRLGCAGIKALGIGLIVAGVTTAIMYLIKYLKDPSWENFGGIIQGIGIAIIGLGALFLGLPGIIAGVVVLIVGTIIKHWDKIKAFLQKRIDWLTGKSDFIHQKFGDTIGGIYDFFVGILKNSLNWFDLTFTSIKGIFDGIIKFIKGVFTGDWKMAWEGIKEIFANIWNWIFGTAKNILFGLINFGTTIASTVGNIIGNVFKVIVNAILSTVEDIMNAPARAINKLIDKIATVPGMSKVAKLKLSTVKLPRLATGAVIPPRQEFAAILGDQKHGTNIETPSQLMSDIFDERLEHFFNKINALNKEEKEIVFRNLTIVAQFGERNFQKIVVDAIRLSEKEMGKQLFVS